MTTGFLSLPDAPRVTLKNATVPISLLDVPAGRVRAHGDGLARVDLVLSHGRVVDIMPGGTPSVLASVDLKGAMVWPGFDDVHTHRDTGHIWPRRPNPDGSFPGALAAVGADRLASWTAGDVKTRMEFSLRCAYAHGTVAIRTHIDSAFGQEDISWPVVADMRETWAGRITLQAASLTGADGFADPEAVMKIARIVKRHGGILGCVTYKTPNLGAALDNVFKAAFELGLELDFHVDENQDPESRSLEAIADKVIETGYDRPLVVGHCCSIVRQSADEQKRVIDKLARARIAVVSLPMCNLYLQDRTPGGGITPRYRGPTLLHEMKAAGVPVMIASDNTRDPFYAYGDMDGLEVYREATRILHLDHPVGDWPATITATPARHMGLTDRGVIRIDGPADLVVFRARSFTELLSRPQSDRTVLRAGAAIDTALPDYSELDSLMETRA